MHIQASHLSHSMQHRLQHSQSTVSVEFSRPEDNPDAELTVREVPLNSGETQESRNSLLAQSIDIPTRSTTSLVPEDISSLDHRLLLMKAMIAAMTGDKIPMYENRSTVQTEPEGTLQIIGQAPIATALPSETLVRAELNLQEEYEYTRVNIGGQLTLDDGSVLDINLDLAMERHYQESALDVIMRERELTDPLVLNFGDGPTRLSAERVGFDLDSDGDLESIASFASQSAYLAYDRNGDGKINNGSELFGPKTGNGFTELASYDDDGNGFIDAKDRIYSQLSAFDPSINNHRSLQALGITALSLDAVASPFRLTDENNQTLGQVRSTSFYLTEDKQVHSLQQIDLAV